MSVEFERCIKSVIGNTYYKEWQGLFGHSRLCVLFERRWRNRCYLFWVKTNKLARSSNASFRYRSFSDYSYVVLPEETAIKALEHLEMFIRYGIGLISFSNTIWDVKYSPLKQKPFSDNMREKVESRIRKSRKRAKGNVKFLLSTINSQKMSKYLFPSTNHDFRQNNNKSLDFKDH